MKKTWSVFFLIFILQTNYLQSQDTPSIEVVGYAEISIVPNQIYYKVVLGDKRLGKEFYQLKNIDLQFWSVIKKHKIDESKVKVKDTSSRNIQYRRKKDEVLKTKTYEILFDDINLLDQFSEDLSKVEIISSKITSINHSQILTIEEDYNSKFFAR